MLVVYNGPHDLVEVIDRRGELVNLPVGVTVERGVPVDVSDDLGEALTLQEHWSVADAKTSAKTKRLVEADTDGEPS